MVRKSNTRPVAVEPDEPEDDGPAKTTSMAVDAGIANQIRALNKKYGISTVDITNQLLAQALKSAKIEVKVKTVVISLD